MTTTTEDPRPYTVGTGLALPDHPDPGPKQMKCTVCGEEFESPSFALLGRYLHAQLCEKCEAHKSDPERWQDQVPPAFRDTEERRMAEEMPTVVRAMRSWSAIRDSGKSLGIVGPVSTGKSRAAWWLVGTLRCLGKHVLAMSATEIEAELEEDRRIKSQMARAEYLLVDDLGAPMGARAEQALHYVIAQREKFRRPIIWTIDGELKGFKDSATRRDQIRHALKAMSIVAFTKAR